MPCVSSLEVRVAEAVDLSAVPKMVRVKSPYANVDGGYALLDETFDGFPLYQNEEDGKFLWHARADRRWMLSDAAGNRLAYNSAESDEKNVSEVPETAWVTQPFSVHAVTWEGIPANDTGFFDRKFPADPSSMGLKPPRPVPAQWIRAPSLNRADADKLFDEVHPNDCMQGGVGNCWLIAAVASVAEFPSAIERLFEPKTVAADGKYTVSPSPATHGMLT